MTAKRTKFAAYRKRVGLTQEGLADALDVERSTVVRWEQGLNVPRPGLRPALARIFDISIAELARILGEENETANPSNQTEPHQSDLRFQASLQEFWQDDVSDAELWKFLKSHDEIKLPTQSAYRNLAVSIDIKNPQGDACITYLIEMINCGDDAVFGETKSVWFEQPSPTTIIVPLALPCGTSTIQVKRDYGNIKQFFCMFPRAVRPGESFSYGYRYEVAGMFTQNHYWDQSIKHLSRRVHIEITHNKQRLFQSAHVECESQFGVHAEAVSDLQIEDRSGILKMAWTKMLPQPDSKYTIYWSFHDQSPV